MWSITTRSHTSEGAAIPGHPLCELATKYGGSKLMANTAPTGFVLGMPAMEPGMCGHGLKGRFAEIAVDITVQNISASRQGSGFIRQHIERWRGSLLSLSIATTGPPMEERIPVPAKGPLARQSLDCTAIARTI